MPVIESSFRPKSRIFRDPQISTIYANLLRFRPRIQFTRERITLLDTDFLDLDWSRTGSKKLVLILSGLEGKSNSPYSKSAVHYFNQKNWDVVCMNYRGCSGEPNRLLNGYHMGATGDIAETIDHILQTYDYTDIVLMGYSLGGNLALKYVGESADILPEEIKATISFSVPMELKKSNHRLNKWYNWHYKKWFMIPLNYKANRKKKQFPEQLKNYRGFFMTGDFIYFDTHYTAPANGYASVEEYWNKSSCIPHLTKIKVPSLIINSRDDTFISEDCYPYKSAAENNALTLELSDHGGHCGFISSWIEKESWMEKRAHEFVEDLIK